jgi:nitric oxide reductase NorQ protein
MNDLQPGYVFETVFWTHRQEGLAPRLVGRNVNGAVSPAPILCEDRRVLPGQRVKVKVESVTDGAVQVAFLGLVAFDLGSVYVDPVLLRQLEILLCSGRSILLEGPQGTGKTTISRELARSLGMEYVFFNCSVCFEPADFVGSLQLLVDDQGRSRTEWLPTDVLNAISAANERPLSRFLVFLDELNRCRGYALNGIMSAIDSTRRIFDPRRNAYVPIPENVQWIAAVNAGKQFTGTYKLDLAQLDRFAVLKIDYPPEQEETPPANPLRYGSTQADPQGGADRQPDSPRRDHCHGPVHARHRRGLHVPELSDATETHLREDLLAILTPSFCNRLPGSVREEATEAHTAYRLIERNVLLNEAALEDPEETP